MDSAYSKLSYCASLITYQNFIDSGRWFTVTAGRFITIGARAFRKASGLIGIFECVGLASYEALKGRGQKVDLDQLMVNEVGARTQSDSLLSYLGQLIGVSWQVWKQGSAGFDYSILFVCS